MVSFGRPGLPGLALPESKDLRTLSPIQTRTPTAGRFLFTQTIFRGLTRCSWIIGQFILTIEPVFRFKQLKSRLHGNYLLTERFAISLAGVMPPGAWCFFWLPSN